jgi:hypothetical protein
MSDIIEHANVDVALGAAQIEMGRLIKGSTNSAFKKPDGKPSTYADLADVVDAVRVPFANNGLAFYHFIDHRPELGMCMVTRLIHGKSGTYIECPVPMIIDRNNMHGLKSASTYCKRIGVESISGIAPEDDDGNAASKAAPKVPKQSSNGSLANPPHPSASSMKKTLAALDADLADCFSTVTLDSLEADYEYGMERDNWPGRDTESEFYEQSYPCQVRRKFYDRRMELERSAAPLTERNILMAGE